MPTLKEILAARKNTISQPQSESPPASLEEDLFVLVDSSKIVGGSSLEVLMILMAKTDAHPSTQNLLCKWLMPVVVPQNTQTKFIKNFCPFVCVELASRLHAPLGDVYAVWVGLIKKGFSDG